ncbi:TRIC cation channel family protein [Streptomyces sp. NPDC050400]|uniref:TRIC cation channel family protein n=1 Tax=Streptomyces sp. NPDC050400 TaxID=3365610 RepID=UPI0037B8F08F
MADLVSAATSADVTRRLALAGVGANAIHGAGKAREHRFGTIGFILIAMVAGFGGGMIRDVLLQHGTTLASGISPSPLSRRASPFCLADGSGSGCEGAPPRRSESCRFRRTASIDRSPP